MDAILASAASGELSAAVRLATLALDGEAFACGEKAVGRAGLLCGRAALYARLGLHKHAVKVMHLGCQPAPPARRLPFPPCRPSFLPALVDRISLRLSIWPAP